MEPLINTVLSVFMKGEILACVVECVIRVTTSMVKREKVVIVHRKKRIARVRTRVRRTRRAVK